MTITVDILDACLDYRQSEECLDYERPGSSTVYLFLRDRHGEYKLCSVCVRRRRAEWMQDKKDREDRLGKLVAKQKRKRK